MLILESPWTRQPQMAVGVDWGNPLTRQLRVCVTPKSFYNDKLPSRINGVQEWVSRDGIGFDFVAASSQYVDLGTGAQLDVTGAISILVWYNLTSIPGSPAGFSLFSKDGNTGGRAYTFDLYRDTASAAASGLRLYVNGGGSIGTNMVVEGRLPVAGDDRIAIVTRSVANNFTGIYVDGLLAASTTCSTVTPTATASLRMGARAYAGVEDYFSGRIRLAAMWARSLSATEVQSLSRNPWQLFAPQQIIIPTPAAAAVPTLSASTYVTGSMTSTGWRPQITAS